MKVNDVFSFEDFLAGKIQYSEKKSSTEKVIESTKEEVKTSEKEIDNTISESEDLNPYHFQVEETPVEEIFVEETPIKEMPVEKPVERFETIEENFYPLYKDKSEIFSCDIYVEGAKTDESVVRLIVESDDWTLMFPGEIRSGKVNIPIRRLSLFEEGQKGRIKLEVIAEGTVFIPWEDEFKIKLSKKVTVSMNENKKPLPPINKLGVRVNVKK